MTNQKRMLETDLIYDVKTRVILNQSYNSKVNKKLFVKDGLHPERKELHVITRDRILYHLLLIIG